MLPWNVVVVVGFHLAVAGGWAEGAFMNFETAPVHPIALSPDHNRLAVCNLADGKLEIFDVSSGTPVSAGCVAVGMDPVSVRFRNANEAWVVNHISDSVSVVDVAALRIRATVPTLDTPADVVFAGSRAFVSCALPNMIQVFEADTHQLVTNVTIDAERPKALAVSPDGQKVYAAIFESGNATTIIGARFRNLLFFDNAVSRTNGPYAGQNPPPNSGRTFNPPLNSAFPTNVPPPKTGLIVRKNAAGRWMDDNQGDWTEVVSGTNAALTQRLPGWDLPDRDLAVVNTTNFSVSYATGLMNICMALDVNPVSGRVAVVGTEAINEVRFEPNLNGIFTRVKLALVDAVSKTVKDLNPHLDYLAPTVPASERDKSIGDPRSIVWSSSGTRGYVAGMGSRNVVAIDGDGNQVGATPVEVGEGPCGLAWDEARQRLYVFNRFSSSISVVDTATDTVIDAIPMFDPTPVNVAAGRRHLYDTRRTSGLGQAACASCHVDARMDRLAWDLGDPAGQMVNAIVNDQGRLVTNAYHPMKGVMVTQTLQDIIGHEPFHWRGDRANIEAFNGTFTNLQGAPAALSANEMRELRDFLTSIRFPPNPYRNFDNSLSTNIPLRGHVALGEDVLPKGAPLPNGNAIAGLAAFNLQGNFCATCHTSPTGLGLDPFPAGPNGGRHFPLALRLEGSLRSKISQFRNLADKVGMDGTRTESRAGFGFGHDGSVDTLTRFLNGVRVPRDNDVADLTAFLLSVSGSDTAAIGTAPDPSPPAAVGQQMTVSSTNGSPLIDAMVALARSGDSRVDLIVKGLGRGWAFDRAHNIFQSDRRDETWSLDGLLALAGSGSELTLTVVPRGMGVRLGIDRDLDGVLDGDDAAVDLRPPIRISGPTNAPVGMDLVLDAQIGALVAPATGIVWRKDGQVLGTNGTLTLTNVPLTASGEYRVSVVTPFQTFTSAPARIDIVPLVVTISPAERSVRPGSNVLFSAAAIGVGSMEYQWQLQGTNVPGATGQSLAIANAQLTNEGEYRVIAANAYGAVTSPPARLQILINPSVVIRPLNQSVVAGGDATFSFMIAGHPPPFGYLLRKSSSILTNYVTDERLGFLTLFSVQGADAGTYRVVVTNAANPSPGLTFDPVTLTVLADGDNDGLPDNWETQYPAAGNATGDVDGDGQSNLQEYLAGTDPLDAANFLKVTGISLSGGREATVIQFRAASNKTYTVQVRDAANGAGWSRLADVVATPTNRTLSITNGLSGNDVRFYRLVTPRF